MAWIDHAARAQEVSVELVVAALAGKWYHGNNVSSADLNNRMEMQIEFSPNGKYQFVFRWKQTAGCAGWSFAGRFDVGTVGPSNLIFRPASGTQGCDGSTPMSRSELAAETSGRGKLGAGVMEVIPASHIIGIDDQHHAIYSRFRAEPVVSEQQGDSDRSATCFSKSR